MRAETWQATSLWEFLFRFLLGCGGYNDEINLMKSRIFLLLVAFHILAGSLIGQTAPPDGKTQAPAAPASGTPASSAPPPVTPAPAAPTPSTPAGQAPAQLGNPGKTESDESVAAILHVVNEGRVLVPVIDR